MIQYDSTTQWTTDLVAQHLIDAMHVELWTVPIYLAAATSVKDRNTKLPPDIEGNEFTAYDTVMSVAVQEMFHFTCAANLCNALGVTVDVTSNPPDFKNTPTCLTLSDPNPQWGNLATMIDLMIAIETPDTTHEPPTTPQASYNSIGDFYHALTAGITAMWMDMYDPSRSGYQKTTWTSKYPQVPIIEGPKVQPNPDTDTAENNQAFYAAMQNILAIVEQGEGADGAQAVPAAYVPATGQQFWEEDEVSHYERFLHIKANIDSITLYPTGGAGDTKAQNTLDDEYSLLMNQIQASLRSASNSVNLRGMSDTGTLCTKIWEAGGTPTFTYQKHPAPWNTPIELHACQGLNVCAGHGANGSGTMPGDGDCATATVHSCVTTNDCHQQGGCGYATQQYVGKAPMVSPGQNACQGLGGCQVPISPCQVYASGEYEGYAVWTVARKLFQDRMNSIGKGFATPEGASPARVNIKSPTSSGTATKSFEGITDPSYPGIPCKSSSSSSSSSSH